MSEWYYGKGGQQYGPVDEATIKARAATGEISSTDLVWKEGMEKWLPLSEVSELTSVVAASPVAAATASPYTSPQTNPAGVSPAGGMYETPPTSGLAIASLVCGILAVIICYINALFGIPAVICGHMAMKRTKPGVQPAQSGRGMAIAGLICGYIGIAIQVFFVVIIGFAFSSGEFRDEFNKEFEKEMEKQHEQQQD